MLYFFVQASIVDHKKEKACMKNITLKTIPTAAMDCVLILPTKERIDQIIHTGQQHRDDGRYSHGAYHTMDRRLGQECIFIAHCFILQS